MERGASRRVAGRGGLASGCRITAVVLTATVALALAAAPASGASFAVDSVADAHDANPGNGICATAVGQCTIRAAVDENNAGASGQDVVNVPAGDYQYNDFNGPIQVGDDVRILGAGAGKVAIHPNSSAQLFAVAAGAKLDLRGVTLRDGDGSNGGAIFNAGELLIVDSVLVGNGNETGGTSGGAIYTTGPLTLVESRLGGLVAAQSNLASAGKGGAIWAPASASGTITLVDTVVVGNRADSASGGAVGGGIGVASSGVAVRLLNSTVAGNVARTTANGLGSEGGGIATVGELELTDSQIIDNESRSTLGGANVGGGIAARGNLGIDGSTIDGNYAQTSGGGLWFAAGPSFNSGTVTASTIVTNQAQQQGGGAFVARPLSFENSTLTANVTTGALSSGGAVNVADTGSAFFVHTTVAGNISAAGDAIYTKAPPSGGWFDPVILRASIIEGAPGELCGINFAAAPIASFDFNVVSDTSCNLDQAHDLPGTDADVASLADNGGPTKTHAIAKSSPAYNLLGSFACSATDQRGVARPQFGACDAGSFEIAPPPDQQPPGLTADAKGRQKLGKAVKVFATCDEDCRLIARGTLRVITPRKGRKARKRSFPIGEVAADLLAGKRSRLRPPLTGKGRRAAARALARKRGRASARLKLTATDGAQNSTKESLSVKLKR